MANRVGWRGLRRTLWALTFGLLSCSVGTGSDAGANGFLGLAGCSPARSPGAPLETEPLVTVRSTMPPLVFTSWAPPDELVSDPKTRARIAAFVPHSRGLEPRFDGPPEDAWRVEGPAIGVAGRSSEEFEAFDALDRTLTPAESVALLRVDNPPLRVYVAGHVALHLADRAADTLYPLLADHTTIGTRDGCIGREESVGSLVLDDVIAYGFANDTEKNGYLKVVANDARIDSVTRGVALAEVARLDRAAARPIALAAVSTDDATWRRNGIRALGIVGDVADLDLVMAFAQRDDERDRSTGLEALGGIHSPLVKERLKELALRPGASFEPVRSYAAQDGVTDDDLAVFLTNDTSFAASEAGRQIAQHGTLHGLELLEPSLMGRNPPLAALDLESFLAKVGAPGFPIMRHLLGAQLRSTRDAAITSLGDLGDMAAVPALRNLAAKGESTYLVAQALGRLHATEATPDLVKMLGDTNPNTRADAAKALVQLNAKTALPALEAAASSDTSFAKPDLEKAVEALRR